MTRALTFHAALCDAVADSLEAGDVVRLRVGGSSMRPFLREGDEVRIVPARPEDLRSGDIVLVRTSGGATLHRVLSLDLRDATLRTKGDGMRETDPPLAAGAIVGKADAVMREGAWRALDTPGRRAFASFVSRRLAPLEPLRAAARVLIRLKQRAARFPS
jgi:hypothetical protein